MPDKREKIKQLLYFSESAMRKEYLRGNLNKLVDKINEIIKRMNEEI